MRWLFALVLVGCVSYAPAPACDAGEACPAWQCECGVGSASARACVSKRCAVAADVCRSACADAGTCWQGRAKGGWPNGNSVGQTVCMGGGAAACGDRDFNDLGKACLQNAECASGLCLGNAASFICAKTCTKAAECPTGWVCGVSTAGSDTCFIGAPGHEGLAVSTNAGCQQVAFSDIGKVCQFGTDCESRICFGSGAAGYFCSRRCNDDSLCASGFRCVTSQNDGAKFCEKMQ
ncbi:MAG: hypothetical protein JNK82_36855 [Myxococcaceae bacterium]|nr:hypothetical protein [Myxococcaceae bacterium]